MTDNRAAPRVEMPPRRGRAGAILPLLLICALAPAPGHGQAASGGDPAQARQQGSAPPAAGGAPMSAIDWLSLPPAPPASPLAPQTSGSSAVTVPRPGEAPVSPGIGTETITVAPLDGGTVQAIGLLPAARSGLPAGLWGATPETELARLVRSRDLSAPPAIRRLFQTLLLAELDPPALADGGGLALFLARIDRLIAQGALEPALAMLEAAEASEREIFRRRFDIALLLGEEDDACALINETPAIAPDAPAAIFCRARQGDWAAAEAGFAEATGHLPAAEEALLAAFLDPELAEEAGELPRPRQGVTPLGFRMMEAIGQPLGTAGLPVAFARADLLANTGWKARIEAAERLARQGSLDPNQLLGLYTERSAAASGGVWERVRAVSALDAALAAGDAAAVATALPRARAGMAARGLEPQLAALYAAPLAALGLSGEAGRIAFALGMLSEDHARIAEDHVPETPRDALLVAIARGEAAEGSAGGSGGDPAVLPPPATTVEQVLQAAFSGAPVLPDAAAALIAADRAGEALLHAMEDVARGAAGDQGRLAAGLAVLRGLGLEPVARRAALEILVLGGRG